MADRKTPIWLDCDPGHDDAFAIILAAEHPTLNLLGISTVHGNAPMSRVTHNALSLLTAIGRSSVPVYAGASKPYMRPAVHAPDIHGASGIDGTLLLPPPAAAPQSGNCIFAMRTAIMATPARTCLLVATGTLTNLALLFGAFPEVAEHVAAVSIMGGAFGRRDDCGGNITPSAEFNIFCDPESSMAVLSNPNLSGRVTLIPLDVTHTVRATKSVLERLHAPGGKLRQMLGELLMYFAETYERVFGIGDGPPLHDPLALAAVLPGGGGIEWEWEVGRVVVGCCGEDIGRTRMTVVGEDGGMVGRATGLGSEEAQVCKVRVPKSVDVEAFWQVLLDSVQAADGRYVWP